MGGILILALFELCGLALMDALLPSRDRLVRIWLGLCAGLILMMWLPALFAFPLGFTRAAQLLGLGAAAAISGAAAFHRRKQPRERRFTDLPLWLPLALILPMALLGGYLQYTHTLRNVAGELHVGQSTYGDLCLHLGIATSLRNRAFPPDYALLPGTPLGYPFLGDSLVTTMLLFGGDLAACYALTGALMQLLVFTGYLLLSWKLTGSRAATALAFALMFLNGGLGFLYALDGVGRDASAFREIFTGFYRTPTNQPDLNLRWVNVICDMMVPQRTLLTGWTVLLPALYLLMEAVQGRELRLFGLLGVWAGAMPMIHTHSFLALGLISAGAMAYCLLRTPKPGRAAAFAGFALYAGAALLLALPQLLTWSVPQTVNGGSLRLRFNWVNNQGDGRLIDGYVWFWVKNVGLIWLIMVPAALTGPRADRGEPFRRGDLFRMLGLGALLIYIAAETVQFQPNPYDNNKLFYVAYMAMLPAVSAWLVSLWDRMKGLRGRSVLACAFLVSATLSGALSLARETVSDYRLFAPEEAAAARFVDENTPRDAVVLTGRQHNNPISALAGRDIVCGPGTYLYFHGLDYSRQQLDEALMLEAPAENTALLDAYGVDYVYISGYERGDFNVDEAWFDAHADLIFSQDTVRLYARRAPSWSDPT